ncbi:MAG: pyridoxamine 5'-phosphate oxidase family protein [Microthrixaceae bacterium]
MATWAEFEAAEPEMAALGLKPPKGMAFALAYLATVRADGAPRVHPFCPIFADGRLFAAIPRTSPKGNDLRRDDRYVIHALPFGHDDGEFSLRGRAREVSDADTRATVQAAVAATGVGGMVESVSHDQFDIERADVARWENVGQPGTYAVRRRWPG